MVLKEAVKQPLPLFLYDAVWVGFDCLALKNWLSYILDKFASTGPPQCPAEGSRVGMLSMGYLSATFR